MAERRFHGVVRAVRSWWGNVFGKPEKHVTPTAYEVLTGMSPIYSSGFGNDVYASDVVRHGISAIVTELKKLDPVHVRRVTGTLDFTSVDGDVQKVLDNPNPLMTTADFIEKVIWTLLLNDNAFVYKVYDNHGVLRWLYPLQPTLVEIDNNCEGSGQVWIRLTFANGDQVTMPYEDIIHLRHNFSVSEFMGGDINGRPDFNPLLETLRLNETLLRGLAKSLHLQTTINGVAKLKTMQNKDAQIAAIKEFEEKLQANESGILPIDISADYMPITKQVQLLDATTLEFIDRKILRFFGVSIPIVNGDYTRDQYEAFYQKTLEPIIKSMGQAFTKGIFSKREVQGFQNRVVFYVKELIFMNTDQKLNLFNTLGNIGGCYVNEMRTAFGLRPINELQGVRMQSLNFVNSQYAKEYQTGTNADTGENNGSDEGENNKQESGGVNDEQ